MLTFDNQVHFPLDIHLTKMRFLLLKVLLYFFSFLLNLLLSLYPPKIYFYLIKKSRKNPAFAVFKFSNCYYLPCTVGLTTIFPLLISCFISSNFLMFASPILSFVFLKSVVPTPFSLTPNS